MLDGRAIGIELGAAQVDVANGTTKIIRLSRVTVTMVEYKKRCDGGASPYYSSAQRRQHLSAHAGETITHIHPPVELMDKLGRVRLLGIHSLSHFV